MAHPQTAEAVDAPVDDMDSAAAALDKFFTSDDPPADEGQREDDQQSDEEDQGADDGELDLNEDDDQQDGNEPGKPAIEAPVSLTAEEKAKFAQLSPEAQRYVADLESRRADQVQSATTKAAEAQRIAEANAARADAQAEAKFAQQLKAFADRLAPQRPDPRLAHTDPATFIALNAQYEADRAQHDEFVQQVLAIDEGAHETLSQAEIVERDRFLMSLPEVQNEQTRNAFFEKSIGAAKTLGLDLSALNSATGGEWKALHDVAGWKDKADKYDAAMARQMRRVREGKRTTSTKPNAAQPSSGNQQRYRDAKERARKTGDVRDAAAAIAALG